jgi:uncharacterized protein (UPF0147 family)
MTGAPTAAVRAAADLPQGEPVAVRKVFATLGELADDASVPRNVRRGAVSAREELAKPSVALDVRIASAVYVLDDLANDPNLPTHGRTAIWSIISSLESVQ